MINQKQKILSDPVAAFRAQHQHADPNQLQDLGDLFEQAQSLKQQQKRIRTRTKVLSRKIGAAKRSGASIDDLLRDMKQDSSQLKQLRLELTSTENKIMDFFVPKENSAAVHERLAAPDHEPETASRLYSRDKEEIDDVSVDLLKDEEIEWNAYVMSNPVATIHHRAEWRRLLQQTYGLPGYYFLARDNNRVIVGILPLVRLKSRLFGDFLVSMPFFSRGGAVADHPSIEQKLILEANTFAARLNIDHIEYRDDIPRHHLPVMSHKVNMVLDLPDSADELWHSFSSKLRAQIKRPQREHPRILTGGAELLDEFYTVYSHNMRDLGSPAHDKRFIRDILQFFPSSSWIIVMRLRESPVAAGLLLGQGDSLEIPLASTLREVNALSINMLLYWEVLKFAIAHDFKHFDFGRSSKDAGTYRFKKQWGAKPRQLYWHYWLGEKSELPALNPANPKYALAIAVWKRMPLALTRWLGPRLVKRLP